ncbi:MAG TPA: twin-arginine translocation signal domain-containing protein, partial [Chthoniobacterales bacterium]
MHENSKPFDPNEPLPGDPEALDEFLVFGSRATRRRFLKQVAGTGAAITFGPTLMQMGSAQAA